MRKNSFSESNLFSHLFELKSKWIVWSSSCELLVRYAEIILPMSELLSGNRHASTGKPFPSRNETNLPHWVVFPQRSNPSKTIRAPRLVTFPLLNISNCLEIHFFVVLMGIFKDFSVLNVLKPPKKWGNLLHFMVILAKNSY